MRILPILALVGLWLPVAAASGIEDFAALPPCALDCAVSTMGKSQCGLSDMHCICTDEFFTNTVEACVKQSCSIRESLTAKNITQTTCGAPIRSRKMLVDVSSMLGFALAALAFVLRMIARLPYFGGTFGLDDWAMVLTMAMTVPFSILAVILSNTGLGKDLWVVPFNNVNRILYLYLVEECLYLAINPLIKISILLFYLRVFPDRKFRNVTYLIIGLNLAYFVAFEIITIFQCKPIAGAWLRWDRPDDFQCQNVNAQGWAAAAIIIVLDIMVLLLPVRDIFRLNLSRKKKAYVMLMFSLGLFVTLVSILRLETLIHFSNSENPTWDYVTVGSWSTVEVHVGVICACLPAIRALLRRIWPRVFGDSTVGRSTGVSKTHSQSRPDGSSRYSSRVSARFSSRISRNSKVPEGPFVCSVEMENTSQSNLVVPSREPVVHYGHAV